MKTTIVFAYVPYDRNCLQRIVSQETPQTLATAFCERDFWTYIEIWICNDSGIWWWIQLVDDLSEYSAVFNGILRFDISLHTGYFHSLYQWPSSNPTNKYVHSMNMNMILQNTRNWSLHILSSTHCLNENLNKVHSVHFTSFHVRRRRRAASPMPCHRQCQG